MPIRRILLASLFLSIIYVGIGTIYLLLIINGKGDIFNSWGENFENAIFPAYFLGFALGFAGGYLWVLVGQLITLGIMWFLFYLPLLVIQFIINTINKKN